MKFSTELPPDIELATIRAKERYLINCFKEVATVENYKKGYISVPFVNQLIDLRLQSYAADLIAYNIKTNEIPVDKVVQIPYSGNSLATSVAWNFETEDIPLVLGRKGRKTPGAWNQQFIIKEEVESFTTGETSTFVFNEIDPGDRVYLVDDVIANGDTASLIINKFRERGVEVTGMAIYFAKLFQPGLQRVYEETGIKPFYAVGIENITEEGEIFFSKPQF
jgi:adenine/guanine phosphoribosyltransferase-like PRPP-binding protein